MHNYHSAILNKEFQPLKSNTLTCIIITVLSCTTKNISIIVELYPQKCNYHNTILHSKEYELLWSNSEESSTRQFKPIQIENLSQTQSDLETQS